MLYALLTFLFFGVDGVGVLSKGLLFSYTVINIMELLHLLGHLLELLLLNLDIKVLLYLFSHQFFSQALLGLNHSVHFKR